MKYTFDTDKKFTVFFGLFMTLMIFLFGFFMDYELTGRSEKYNAFTDVHVMIFIGFGFLMSFLSKAGFSATAYAYLIAAASVLWSLLNEAFWLRAIPSHGTHKEAFAVTPRIGVAELINADFCAGAVLISMGAVLGRVSASQLMVMAIVEVVLFNINFAVMVHKFWAADIGGSMAIHLFGAVFGIVYSAIVSHKRDRGSHHMKSTPTSDTMAMIGTLFLFVYWPSFNAAQAEGNGHNRAIVNTYVAQMTSVMTTFFLDRLLHPEGKFSMVKVQNSTLAGAVAVGTAANMMTHPFGSMIAGVVAAAASVAGYTYVTPWLDRTFGLKDTCGILNLHGMPGLIGAFMGVIVARVASNKVRDGDAAFLVDMQDVFENTAQLQDNTQANWQLAATAVSIAFAIAGAIVAGLICRMMPDIEQHYHDDNEFELEEEHTSDPFEMKTVYSPTKAAATTPTKAARSPTPSRSATPAAQSSVIVDISTSTPARATA